MCSGSPGCQVKASSTASIVLRPMVLHIMGSLFFGIPSEAVTTTFILLLVYAVLFLTDGDALVVATGVMMCLIPSCGYFWAFMINVLVYGAVRWHKRRILIFGALAVKRIVCFFWRVMGIASFFTRLFYRLQRLVHDFIREIWVSCNEWTFVIKDMTIWDENLTLDLLPRSRNMNEVKHRMAFCHTCSRTAIERLAEPIKGRGMRKTVMFPTSCQRCKPEKFEASWFTGDVQCEAVRGDVNISEDEYSEIMGGLLHHQAITKRDAQTHLVNTMQASRLDERAVFLAQHMARMVNMERIPLIGLSGYAINPGHLDNSKTWSSQFRPVCEATGTVGATIDEVVTPISQVVREHDGKYPQLGAVKVGDVTKKRILELGGPSCVDESLISADMEKKPAVLKPVEDVEWGVTYKDDCKQCGPILKAPCVFDPKNALNARVGYAHRTAPKEKLDIDSAVFHRFRRYVDAAKRNLFTEARVVEALKHLPPLETLIAKKISETDAEEIISSLNGSSTEEILELKRLVTVKFEQIVKSGKSPRLIQDEGFQMMAINVLVASVFEHILFENMHHYSIKHRDRTQVAEEMVTEFSRQLPEKVRNAAGNDSLMLEVDQTCMEAHERHDHRYQGVMGETRTLLNHVARLVFKHASGKGGVWWDLRAEADRKGLSMRMLGSSRQKGKLITFSDYYMPSGWRFTSSVNWFNEHGATLSALCQNPEKLFACDKTGELYTKNNKHDNLYEPLVKHATRPGSKLYVKLRVEGDDVGGRVSAWVRQYEKIVAAEFRALGFSAKMDLIENGRLEFIGVHFNVIRGRVDRRAGWVPDVNRSLYKMGVVTTKGDVAEVCVARFLSLAMMFAGKVSPLAHGFFSLAMSWKRVLDERDVGKIKLSYDDCKNFIGMGEAGQEVLVDDYVARVRTAVQAVSDFKREAERVSMSIRKPVTAQEMTRWMTVFASVERDTDGSELMSSLPENLRV